MHAARNSAWRIDSVSPNEQIKGDAVKTGFWHARNGKPAAAVIGALALTFAGASASSAFGADSSEGSVVPVDIRISTGPQSNVPDDVMRFATDINTRFEPNSLVWDDTSSELTIWVDPDYETSQIESRIATSGLHGVAVRHSLYAGDDLHAAVKTALSAETYAGARVTWAAPKPDGTGIDLGLSEEPMTRNAIQTTVGGIPVSTIVDGSSEPASRDLDSAPFRAGADSNTNSSVAGFITACTTSFALIAYTGSGFEDQMFTADHCIADTPSDVWRTGKYSNSDEIGRAVDGGTNTDIAKIRGKTYQGAMYFGPNTASTNAAVSGYWAPVVGAYVHYSGAPTGTVFNNLITHVDLSVSYGGSLSYDGLVRTVQDLGVPAVGNGDSGGPVFALDSEGNVLATGVISGMSGATDNCGGDPATASRKCSATAFFAPLDIYFSLHPLDGIKAYL